MPLTVTAEVIREHLLYTAWASRRLVHAIEQLSPEQLNQDFESSEHSILGTLGHVFAADRVWVSRVRGEEATALSASDIDLHVLQIDWPLIYAKWNEWAAGLTDDDISGVIAYRDSKGNSHASPVWEIVLHVVNHGTHHRGQAVGFLRALGHTPPSLDLIRYYRERPE